VGSVVGIDAPFNARGARPGLHGDHQDQRESEDRETARKEPGTIGRVIDAGNGLAPDAREHGNPGWHKGICTPQSEQTSTHRHSIPASHRQRSLFFHGETKHERPRT
jgi:hypothetical protein